MSLRTIHLLFILAAIATALGTGVWLVSEASVEALDPASRSALTWICFGLTAGMLLYAIWFLRKKWSKGAGAGLMLTICAGMPSAAHACATCYGQAGTPVIDNMNIAVLFMLGVVGGMLGIAVGFAVYLRRRSLKLERAS